MPSQPVVPPVSHKPPGGSGISTAHRVVKPTTPFAFLSLNALVLAALGLIAFWTVGGQIFILGSLARQAEDAHRITLAERQRMLSQRLCKAALVLASGPEPKEREASVRELDDAVAALTRVQNGLLHGDDHLQIARMTDPLAAGLLKNVAPDFAGMLTAAHQIQHLVHRKAAPDDPTPDVASSCRRLLVFERSYLTGMEPVTAECESEARAHVAGLRLSSLGLSLGTLGILALEALFVFRPTVRRIQTQLGQAKKTEARVADQTAKLQALNAELQAHQDALAAQEADLTEAARSLGELNTRLTQTAGQFHKLFHGLPVACYSFDSYGRAVEWNRTCETLYQRPASEAAQQPLWEIITPPHDWENFREMLTGVLRGASSEREWDQVRPDGSRVRVLCNTFPLHGPNGAIIGGISANLDVSSHQKYESQIQDHAATLTQQREALEKANARLHTLATEDGLTGLKNHRSFHEGLTKEFARVMDSGCREPLSVVIMDVDAFKQYNDTFGHAAGDDVLRRIAQILLKSARGGDLVARYGGEEFAVVLGQTDRRGAQAYAERVRSSIAAAAWSFQAVTASLGVTTLRVDTPAAADLVAEADAALRRAKAAGRNRVTFADDPVAPEAPAAPLPSTSVSVPATVAA